MIYGLLAGILLHHDSGTQVQSFEGLTGRQREILRLVWRRYQIKEIAHQLGISPDVVKQHLAAARERLGGVPSSLAAARLLAEHEGLVPSLEGGLTSGEMPLSSVAPVAVDPSSEEAASVLNDSIGHRPYAAESFLHLSPLPTSVRRQTDLGWRGKLLWGFGLAFFAVAILGAFMELLR